MYLSILGDASKAAAQRPAPRKKNLDAKLAGVDVFVTYCGEGIEIVLNTAKAACVQDFPASLIRVIVLDDSHTTQLEDAIFALRTSREYPNLYYASRNIHVATHSKAANLNFGLSFASTLNGPTPDYISVLDVDMIPSPYWLKEILTSLLQTPTAALVCSAQRFYNISPSDSLGIMHDIAHIECMVYLQNATQKAWCTGSGFIIRRAALEQIGGFPEGHLQEDILTSMLLSAAGWKSAYVLETLQWGLAADTMASWIKQRQRWAAGVLEICQFVSSPQARQVPTNIRLTGILWGVLDTYSSFIWTLIMLILPLALATGKPLLPPHSLRFHLHLALLDFLAQSICQYLLSSLLDHRRSILAHLSAIWTAPLRLVIACRYIIPSILGRPLPRFAPTGSPTTGDSERAARKKGTSCVKIVLWECGGWIHVLCLGICVAGIVASVREVSKTFSRATSIGQGEDHLLRQSLQSAFEAFITRVGFPPIFLLLLAILKNVWVPIKYAISPPPLFQSKDMLYKDENTGVLYPNQLAKGRAMKRAEDSFWWQVAAFYAVVLVMGEVWVWGD